MITDTHVHLDTTKFNKDIEEVLKRARNNDVKRFIIPAIESTNTKNIIELVEKHHDIYFATGNHPNRPNSYNIKEIEKLISHEKCVAVGECGLDWFRIQKGEDIEEVKKIQKHRFEEQIKLSIKYKKPLILHSRDTDEDMVDTLMKYAKDLVGGVIHCYVGSEKLLELEKYNFYYGIGGVLTYKTAVELRENVKKIPLSKLLLETDAPYLTPDPLRKKHKRNEPAFTRRVLEELSLLLNIDSEELGKQIEANADALFFNK